ncbi:MAG TPA: hypothetical protein GXZ35_06070 [Acholeplasmataceae bacterium]|nr:hypothetical protein [Acholeplasmataceae bacterium]
MKSFFELLAVMIQLLIYVVIFALQVLAPLMTLLFLIITFINPNGVTMTIFYVSAISYFVGYLTSNLGIKSIVPIYKKSHLDIHHPILSTLINMVLMFLPSFFSALIVCLIFSDFTYYIHYAIMVNWVYRVMNWVYRVIRNIQSNKNDNLRFVSEEFHGVNINEKAKPLSDSEIRKNLDTLRNVPGGEKNNDELIEQARQYRENKKAKETLKNTPNFDADAEQVKGSLEYMMTREKDLLFTAASLTYGFKKIKNDLKVSNGKAIFGSLFILEMAWLEAEILSLNDIVDMLTDARSSVCTLSEYWDVHGYGTPFTDEVAFLTNLSMTDSCKEISINKPEIEQEQIVNFIIDRKEQIKKAVLDAMNDSYDLGMMKAIIEINIDNGIKQYEKLIKGFKEEGIQPK